MARRYVHEEPVSQLAIWARRMAFFALAASFLAVIIVRSGLLEIKPAIATFGGALAIAGIALLLAFAAFVSIWIERPRRHGRGARRDGDRAAAARLSGLSRHPGLPICR